MVNRQTEATIQPSSRDVLDDFQKWIQRPISIVPVEALGTLSECACGDTGGSEAARSFLFWLCGKPDPSGFVGQGALELRRMDFALQNAATEVFAWWIGPVASDEPLYAVLRVVEAHWQSHRKGDRSS